MYKTLFLLTLLFAGSIGEEAQPSSSQGGNQVRNPQQEASMKQTACLILSRQHSNSKKDEIQQIINQYPPEDQQKYVNKMYALAVQYCFPKITMDDAQQFFIENPSFNSEDMFHYFDGFNYHTIQPSGKLTKNQQNLVRFIKNFDEQWRVRREQREATKDNPDGQSEFEMKFFGFSGHEIPSSLKYVYVIIFAVIVIGAIAYMMSKLNSTQKNKSSSKKKKSQSPSASPPKSTQKKQ